MPSSIEPHSGWHVVLALCSVMRRCAVACIAAGGVRTSTFVRVCVRGVSGTWHVGLWLRCVLPARNGHLRGASSPHLPSTSGQSLCSMAGVYKFIMPLSLCRESETESADFFTNPSETARLPDFENRNNTT